MNKSYEESIIAPFLGFRLHLIVIDVFHRARSHPGTPILYISHLSRRRRRNSCQRELKTFRSSTKPVIPSWRNRSRTPLNRAPSSTTTLGILIHISSTQHRAFTILLRPILSITDRHAYSRNDANPSTAPSICRPPSLPLTRSKDSGWREHGHHFPVTRAWVAQCSF